MYGKPLEKPVKLKSEPEPRYNYDDYLYELKQGPEKSHKIAREVKLKRNRNRKRNTIKIKM